MATLTKSTTKAGGPVWVIQFFLPGNKRKTIRLAQSKAEAEANDGGRSAAAEKARYIEAIAAAKRNSEQLDGDTALWLSRLKGPLRDKLIDAGLIDRPAAPISTQLGAFTRTYIDSRKDVRPRTRINLDQARGYLIEHFGEDKPLAGIAAGHADEFRRWLREQVGENTTRRHCGRAKQFFRAACRKRLITENPFADMKQLVVGANRERDYFITLEETYKVLDACPDNQWRLLFALSRFGGLRCPSEHLQLTWDDIDWDRGRMLVRSPKTERHEGKESRVVPVFPELRPYLQAAWDDAPDGAKHVIAIPTIRADQYANIRSRMKFIIEKRAKLLCWPKLFHNLRASRETELAATFPQHVVCEWIGNDPRVATKHYLRVTDTDFERATMVKPVAALQPALHGAAPGAADPSRPLPTHPHKRHDVAAPVRGGRLNQYPRRGSNIAADSQENLGAGMHRAAPALHEPPDAQLAALIGAWGELPRDVRRAIATIVKAARKSVAEPT